MSDELFPSGPWVGFYNYRQGDRHRMDLQLESANGQMTGEGIDDIGRFAEPMDALGVWQGQVDNTAVGLNLGRG